MKTYETRKTPLKDKIIKELDALEVGGTLRKKELIIKLWGKAPDFFLYRSFDIPFLYARRELSDKVFKTSKGIINRVS